MSANPLDEFIRAHHAVRDVKILFSEPSCRAPRGVHDLGVDVEVIGDHPFGREPRCGALSACTAVELTGPSDTFSETVFAVRDEAGLAVGHDLWDRTARGRDHRRAGRQTLRS